MASRIVGTDREALLSVAKKFGTPVYVYNQERIEEQCQKLIRHFPGVSFHYAVKANSNPTILSIIRKQGIGSEAVSLGELKVVKASGFSASRTSFTCSNLTEQQLRLAAASGARVHLDSLRQLETWGRLKLGRDVSLRLNQGVGAGHHAHVITGGPHSKFGVSLADVPAALTLAERYKLRITGIQQHIGSNALDASVLLLAMRTLLKTATSFKNIEHIDFGGGLGIPYAPEEKQLDLKTLGKEFRTYTDAFKKKQGREIAFSMEPGRFIVAEAGALLVSVVDAKETTERRFVGVSSGFNQLVRPTMYGSYHSIDNLSRTRGKSAKITIAGNVCESGDVFAVNREMVVPEIGDTLAIRNAGAYGFTMASTYNMHALPKEVLVTSAGRTKDISFSPGAYAL